MRCLHADARCNSKANLGSDIFHHVTKTSTTKLRSESEILPMHREAGNRSIFPPRWAPIETYRDVRILPRGSATP